MVSDGEDILFEGLYSAQTEDGEEVYFIRLTNGAELAIYDDGLAVEKNGIATILPWPSILSMLQEEDALEA